MDLCDLQQDLVEGLRLREEGTVVAALDLEDAVRRVLADQLLLGIWRQHVVIERLDEVAADGAVVLWGEGELLHDWG